MHASRASMIEILAFIEAERARGATTIELDVLDPDRGRGLYAGETIELDGSRYIHWPFRTWVDLAERLGLRLAMPRAIDDMRVRLRFDILDRSMLVKGAETGTEKYGVDSDFARVHKLEDPGFVVDMREALGRVLRDPQLAGTPTLHTRGARADLAGTPEPHASAAPRGQLEGPIRVLYLGCNTGDEIALILALCPALRAATHVGVDHSASALAAARERFAAQPTIALHEADITRLGALGLGRFDLIVSIGTLQSAGLDDRDLLRVLVQDYLAAQGALIIGVPNCRYLDGEVEYGARMRNFTQPELGLLVKDIAFYRKYLQQHHKQVFVTGKHYVLVTAVPTRGE